jgi:regulator of protease activity HflC (stomatin/prohibitin superfamily)
MQIAFSALLVVLFILAFNFFFVLREYERAVTFTLGRFTGVKGPGLIFVIPFIQQIVRVELRTVVMDVPPQDVISRDNVSVRVSAVVYFRVIEADRAVIQVEDYYMAVSQFSQTTLRSVLGQHELDEMLAERTKLNADIQKILDEHTNAWGIKITMVEIKHIDINENMVRAIAKQAEAERERRAKVIHADGELQASTKLLEAAQILSKQPEALQLRYLQTLSNIGEENNTTIVFPVPIDLLSSFLKK